MERGIIRLSLLSNRLEIAILLMRTKKFQFALKFCYPQLAFLKIYVTTQLAFKSISRLKAKAG